MKLLKSSQHLTMACILLYLLILWINLLWGERIPINHHLGFDGTAYGEIAVHFKKLILSKSLNRYIIHRILPSGLIWLFLKCSGLTLSLYQIPSAFAILNGLLISLSLFLWLSIAKHQKWGNQLTLLSLTLLFLNFAIFKMSAYYPTLTDIPAFFLGTLLCYGVVKHKPFWILASGIFSLFTFPSHFALTFIFLALTQREFLCEFIWKKNPSLFAGLITLCLFAITYFLYKYINHHGRYFMPMGRINNPAVTALSGMLSLGVFFLGVRTVLFNWIKNNPARPIELRACFNSGKLILLLLSIAWIAFKIVHPFSQNITVLSLPEFLDHLTTQSLAYPFIHIISHTIYYGALIPLLILFWKPVTLCAKEMGVSFVIFLLFSLLFSIESESRQFINLIPLLVFILIQSFHTSSIVVSTSFLSLSVGINLFLSKCWLLLNQSEWPNAETVYHNELLILQSPMQWYFMQQGPWMGHTAYLVNSIITLMIFAILYFYFHQKNKTPL